MKIVEYLSSKYKEKWPNAILSVEARALGIEFPLVAGWLLKHSEREITLEMEKTLVDALQRLLLSCKSERKAQSIKAGLAVLSAPDVAWRPDVYWTPTKVRKPRAERKPRKPREQKLRVQHKRAYVAGVDVSSAEFLSTYEWRQLRMQALRKYGPKCMCCGASPQTGAVMNVDHIKPRKTHPHLALDLDNLQILCHECNHGKGNWDQTDWRPLEEHVDSDVVAMLKDIARHG